MPLVHMKDLLRHAHAHRYAVGAFDLVSLDFLEGVPAAAEHLIVYNVAGLDAAGVQAMMAEGRRVLGAIPGVRAVVTGEAVKADADYRYTWLVRFCHPAVIDSYREHPAHVAFADQRFRPVAGRRISIDFQAIEARSQERGGKTEERLAV